MRFTVLGAIVLSSLLLPETVRAYDLPYDPYPWCANYGGRFGGASNCGFSTWNQGMATVSGIGGFCARNQFYNPRPSSNARASGRPITSWPD
jgi:Protein of unknown function (DUF3551)